MRGYASRAYAESVAEWSPPRPLTASGGWLIEREITGASARDATGCYPLFACRDWSQLGSDLDALGTELVSVTLVSDSFARVDTTTLQKTFPDLCRPYKEHFVSDLTVPADEAVVAHHRRNARQALSALAVDVSTEPLAWFDEWCALYDTLIHRHHVDGVARFSRGSFARQLAVPGIVAFRARQMGTTVGMTLWYVSDDVAYYHLGAYSATGYDARASFALFWRAREHFAPTLRWLALGAGAGIAGDPDDGLTRFKRGWATGTRTVYLCGRILDPERYRALTAATGIAATNYFPAYRAGSRP